MSSQIVPKCPACPSTNFKVEANQYVTDINDKIFQFVFCSACGATVGVLPMPPKST